MSTALWTEKYRSKTVDDYVFKDTRVRKQVNQWIKDKTLPNLILTGGPGVGKTTLCKLLLIQLGVDPFDVKEINGSKDNGVDFIRDTIDNFSTIMPFGDFKYILIDEFDYLSINSQACLRNAMEANSNTVRFLFTANYPQRIMPALMSRCQHIHIDKLDKDDFTSRIADILITEEVEIDLDTLDTYVSVTFPDMRKCINLCQQNTIDGKLILPDNTDSTADYKIEAIELFKQGKFKEARTLICKQIQPEEYDEIYRFMYQNMNLWASSESQEEEAIIIIRDALCKHAVIADPEINLSATFILLGNIEK